MKSLFRQPRGFYRRLFSLAAPCVLQNLVTTALGFMDTFMVGLLGNAEMAAVTAANVPIFILQLLMFGFQSGMSILISQYWGQDDTDNINRVTGLALLCIAVISSIPACIMFFSPAFVLGLVTDEASLIALGVPYLRLVGVSVVFDALSTIYVGMQRSTENPRFGMILFGISMAVNTLGNYVLIFGKFGFPMLGITGAAAATLASRILEFCIALCYALTSRRVVLRPALLLHPGKAIARSFLKYATPVVCNETLWALGTSMLTVVMGHMDNSVDMLAAYALMGNIDKFATVVCFGVAAATAVIVGKEIGEGQDRARVQSTARSLLAVAFLVGTLTGLLLLALLPLFFRPVLFRIFDLSAGAASIAGSMCLIYSLVMPMRAFDVTNITGVLRSGGDVRAAICIDLIPLWCIAVPLSALLGVTLHTDAVWVCVAMQAENFCKLPTGILRFHSGKWIHNVTRTS